MISDIFQRAMDSFERVLRIGYPGLLFMTLLPLAMAPSRNLDDLGLWATFYSGLGGGALVGLVLASGLFWYIIGRYAIQEPFLAVVLVWWLHTGAAANFAVAASRPTKKDSYFDKNARMLWTRFGKRPKDLCEADEAENRFDRYMANRMAWVHSLGSTCLVPSALLAVSRFNDSILGKLHGMPLAVLVVVLVVGLALWVWHGAIAARAEQWHYENPDAQ